MAVNTKTLKDLMSSAVANAKPSKDEAAMMIWGMMAEFFSEECVLNLVEDLTECRESGNTDPVIVVHAG